MPAPTAQRVEARSCQACGLRISWLNLCGNLALAVFKCLIGILADSRALVALSLYSINDALSAAVVIVSLHLGRRPPDADHTYGHGKIEFVAVGGLAVILAGSVLYFIAYVIGDIFRGSPAPPHLIAILVAGVTAVTSSFLARWGHCAAVRLNSPAMHTSAEHNHSDAVSSVLTIVAVTGAMLGLGFLDPMVALFEAVDVMRLSGRLFGTTIKGLMDTALSPDELALVERTALGVPGVLKLKSLRSRRSGPQAWVDLELELAGEQSIEEGDRIRRAVQGAVLAALAGPAEVQVVLRTAPPHLAPRGQALVENA